MWKKTWFLWHVGPIQVRIVDAIDDLRGFKHKKNIFEWGVFLKNTSALYCFFHWFPVREVCGECRAIMYLCMCSHVLWRPSERRSPPRLLGAWPGHPVLPQLPARLHCQAVQAPLSRLWPRGVRRLLPREAARSVTGLGPPRPCVHKLQPESRGTLTGRRLPSSEQWRQPLAPSARSLSLLYLCSSDGSVLYLWKGSFIYIHTTGQMFGSIRFVQKNL